MAQVVQKEHQLPPTLTSDTELNHYTVGYWNTRAIGEPVRLMLECSVGLQLQILKNQFFWISFINFQFFTSKISAIWHRAARPLNLFKMV